MHPSIFVSAFLILLHSSTCQQPGSTSSPEETHRPTVTATQNLLANSPPAPNLVITEASDYEYVTEEPIVPQTAYVLGEPDPTTVGTPGISSSVGPSGDATSESVTVSASELSSDNQTAPSTTATVESTTSDPVSFVSLLLTSSPTELPPTSESPFIDSFTEAFTEEFTDGLTEAVTGESFEFEPTSSTKSDGIDATPTNTTTDLATTAEPRSELAPLTSTYSPSTESNQTITVIVVESESTSTAGATLHQTTYSEDPSTTAMSTSDETTEMAEVVEEFLVPVGKPVLRSPLAASNPPLWEPMNSERAPRFSQDMKPEDLAVIGEKSGCLREGRFIGEEIAFAADKGNMDTFASLVICGDAQLYVAYKVQDGSAILAWADENPGDQSLVCSLDPSQCPKQASRIPKDSAYRAFIGFRVISFLTCMGATVMLLL